MAFHFTQTLELQSQDVPGCGTTVPHLSLADYKRWLEATSNSSWLRFSTICLVLLLKPYFIWEINLFHAYECFACLPACTYMHHMPAWCPQRLEVGNGHPRTWVTAGCEYHVGTGREPGSSARAAGALNRWAIPPGPLKSHLKSSLVMVFLWVFSRTHETMLLWMQETLHTGYVGQAVRFCLRRESSSPFLEVGGRETLWSGLLSAASACCLPEDLRGCNSQSLSPDLRLSPSSTASFPGACRLILRQEVGNWASEAFCAVRPPRCLRCDFIDLIALWPLSSWHRFLWNK